MKALFYAIHEPTRAWFKFIYQCAKSDADKDTALYKSSDKAQGNPHGPCKYLVYFQRRCGSIKDYSDNKLKKIIAAFKRDNYDLRSLDVFIWAILLTNCMILGAFGQQDVDVRSVEVPTDTQFIHELLKIAGGIYYSDPKAALRQEGESLNFDVVEYALNRAIQSIVPFELFVNDIRKKQSFRSVSGSEANKYAQGIIDQARELGSRSRVEDAAGGYLRTGTTSTVPELSEARGSPKKRRHISNVARTSFPESVFSDTNQAPVRWDSRDYHKDAAPPINVDVGTLSSSEVESGDDVAHASGDAYPDEYQDVDADADQAADPATDSDAKNSDDLGFDD